MSHDDALQALRRQGAHLHDPVRFHHLEALAARMQAQPALVRQALASAFDKALADYRLRMDGSQAAPWKSMPRGDVVTVRSPLAQLNADIAQRAKDAAAQALANGPNGAMDDAMDDGLARPDDMKSVRRFAQAWSRIATEQQLARALTRGPAHAGPLNSHNLMLRALSLMNGLSPDYLRRFLAQADALLCLDHLNQQHALGKGDKAGTARRSRARK
jgi:hypothetical protein